MEKKFKIFNVEKFSIGQKEAIENSSSNPTQTQSSNEEIVKMDSVSVYPSPIEITISAVCVTHKHGHPHILLLQAGSSFFKLPSTTTTTTTTISASTSLISSSNIQTTSTTLIESGEDDTDVDYDFEKDEEKWEKLLVDGMNSYFAPPGSNITCAVGECLGTYYRLYSADTPPYPYLPPHIKYPKEINRLYLVGLSDNAVFGVPRNFKLVAVPLFELFENQARYGPVLAALPHLLSRINFEYIS